MQSLGLASVRKSDSLSDCCISCLLKASRLLQSRVLKSALEVSGNLFAHQLFLMSIGGTRRPFCRRGTLGARGVGWALGVLRREGFIYLFSHRANKATRRVPACGPWGLPEGREIRLPFRPCKQRLCELTGPREAAVSDTLVGQVRSMGSRGEVTCARGISRDGRGGALPAAEKRSSFFIRSVYSF